MDANLNTLLKWSVENSSASTEPGAPPPSSDLNPEILAALMGGPSDAELMLQSMSAIQSPDISLENKLVAFDNFEQLVEGIDNANNLEQLKLWEPLVGQLANEEEDIRKMACWCVGTAVQNNEKAQQKLFSHSALPTLVNLSLSEPNEAVRRKAIYALSSAIRNFQPGADAAVKALPSEIAPERVDASNMNEVDAIIEKLREKSRNQAQSS
ncbi:MAG: hsp70 nucleotide exchange factor fes1 [Cirrosporium novae-zelandiae]|nr:MAG: hsp70 nucleotide exchange factor fes1 [Cirrosporium novae-zelandiae]